MATSALELQIVCTIHAVDPTDLPCSFCGHRAQARLDIHLEVGLVDSLFLCDEHAEEAGDVEERYAP